jgi:hypothetical protein
VDRALTRPRARALEILTQVLVHRKSLEHELDLAFREHPEHKAWLQEIISGVLRWKGRLEYAVDSLALRKKPTGKLRRALLLGAYPLIVQKEVNAPARK